MTRHSGHGEPLGAASRVTAIDILRGFALCGILLIHVPIFALPGAPPGMGYEGSWLDTLALYGLILFVEAKFFSLFAALFGVGFAIQWQSAHRQGRPFAPLFRRRLLFLGLFGALHVALLWEGDILLLYAVAGLLLIPFRNCSQLQLRRWILGLLGLPLLVYLLALAGLFLAQQNPASAAWISAAEARFGGEFAAARAEVIARYAGDDFARAALERVLHYLGSLPLLLTRLPSVLAMFLLGFAVGKSGILREVESHLPLLRRARAWGLTGGLSASLLVTLAYGQLPPFAAFSALAVNQALAGPLLALGYASTLLLLVRRPCWQRRLAGLAGYGRMALSSYLLQSAICALLFYGWGLGLVLHVAPLEAIGLALLINGLLIALSGWWLRRFQFGPAEWLWRCLTYARLQPLLRAPRPAPSGAPSPRPTSWLGPVAPGPTGGRYRDTQLGRPPAR
jgi:uncharacterized protein